MTKLNWRDPKDYKYTKELDTKGWAWEFLRRSDAYRKAYAEMKASAQERIPYPEKKKGETENAWKVRVADSGEIARYLTPAQICARKEWQLYKLHAPDTIYNPDKHLFDLHNPFPAFYGEPRNIEDIEDKKEKKRLLKLFQKNPTLLAGLRPLDYIGEPLPNTDNAAIVFIAIDISKSINVQLAKIRKFSACYKKQIKKPQKLSRKRQDELTRFLRILDALSSDEKITQVEILKAVMPKLYKDAHYSQVNSPASDNFSRAQEMTQSGYKELLLTAMATE